MSNTGLCQRYLAAQLEKDQPAALRVLFDEGLAVGISVQELYLEVIQPAQYEIGRLWQANLLTVAEEHIATSMSQLALSMLYPSIPRAASNGLRVLVGCVGGERHDLGARMVADFYEMAGYSVRFLGADVDADRLVAMVREDPPDLLGLSVTMTFNVESLRVTTDRARDAVGDQLSLVLGGAAFSSQPKLPHSVDADVIETDVRVALDHSAALIRSP